MKQFIIGLLLLISMNNLSAQQVLDKIVAVVDKEIILQSELNFQIASVAAQQHLDASDKKLKQQVLNKMIEEKLVYAEAQLDSIQVTDSEVNTQLENQINYFIQQYGSKERLEKTYGMSVSRIKRKLRDDTRKNLMTQRLRQEKFGRIEVTKREVEEFFKNFKDSLGQIPEKFDISHIYINPKAGEKVKKKARDFAQTLLDSIKNGANFDSLARKYSNDPGSKAQGGDLGWVKRGVFYPEFEAAAFKLQKGELSKVVESPVGFHIIQMIDRRGESIHTRHILITVKEDDNADIQTIEFLSSLRDSIIKGVNPFEFYAKKYSNDKETAKFGGELGVFEKRQLDEEMSKLLLKLKPGDISFPTRLDISRGVYGFHIVRLNKRIPSHMPELLLDYSDIKKIAEFRKREKLFNDWITKIKTQIYWKTFL